MSKTHIGTCPCCQISRVVVWFAKDDEDKAIMAPFESMCDDCFESREADYYKANPQLGVVIAAESVNDDIEYKMAALFDETDSDFEWC